MLSIGAERLREYATNQWHADAPITSYGVIMRHFDVASKSATRICSRFFRTCNKPPVISRVHDVTRLRNWLNIGWGHLERITHKQSCVTRFIGHWCILEHLHFVRAVSHSISAHTEALLLLKDKSSSDENDDLVTGTIYTEATAMSQCTAAESAHDDWCRAYLVATRRESFDSVPCGQEEYRFQKCNWQHCSL